MTANYSKLVDDIILEHKKQLDDIKRYKFSVEQLENEKKNLNPHIKEIESYTPHQDFDQKLNFNYKTKNYAAKHPKNYESQGVLSKEINSNNSKELNQNYQENWKNENYNFTDILSTKNFPTHTSMEFNNSFQIKPIPNRSEESTDFLKAKILKKKKKISDLKSKIHYLENDKTNFEKKVQFFTTTQQKLIDENSDKIKNMTEIIDLVSFFFDKMLNLYTGRTKCSNDLKPPKDLDIEYFRKKCNDLENSIIIKAHERLDKNTEKSYIEKISRLESENTKLKEHIKTLITPTEPNTNNMRDQNLCNYRELDDRLLSLEKMVLVKLNDNDPTKTKIKKTVKRDKNKEKKRFDKKNNMNYSEKRSTNP